MTTPVSDASSGRAANAANHAPSLDSRTRSSCSTAPPERTGIGGSESVSKHMARASLRQRFLRRRLEPLRVARIDVMHVREVVDGDAELQRGSKPADDVARAARDDMDAEHLARGRVED